jgi:putative inorganic carbon (HCO3(-)) transporter
MAGFAVVVWQILFSHAEKGTKRIAREAVIFLFCLLTAAVILFGKPVYERFYTSLDGAEGSNVGRMKMWESGLRAFREYPGFGVGLGNFPAYMEPSADYRTPIYAHNLYIDIAAELGIVGLVAWVAWFFGSLMSIIRSSRAYPPLMGVAASLTAFSAHSIFDTPLFSVHILTLLCILLSIRYAYYGRTLPATRP